MATNPKKIFKTDEIIDMIMMHPSSKNASFVACLSTA